MARFAVSRGLVGFFVLVAAALFGVAFPGQADAAQAGGAGLTIHNRICPTGFAGPDYYDTCHDTTPNPGLPFSLTGPEIGEATTDAAGNVDFVDLTPGTYTVSGGVPGEFADVTYFCARRATPAVAFPFTVVTTGISVTLAAGDDVVCDWYNSPIDLSGLPTPTATAVAAPSTLTVLAAICPVDFTGTSYYDECFDRPANADSVVFTLFRANVAIAEEAVGDDGRARFNGVQAGTYLLTDSVPGDFLDGRFVYCTFDGANPVTYDLDYDENAIELTIPAGVDVACDWYIEPTDQGAPTATAVAPTAVTAPTATARPAGPVVGLPNTGAGGTDVAASAAAGQTSVIWITMVAMLGTVAAGLSLAARRMRPSRSSGTLGG